MWRIVLKMLAARKGRYGWLLAELVVVSMAVWVLADPVVVQTFIEFQDKGFDEHRLYRIELKTYSERSPHFVRQEMEQRRDDRHRLLRLVRSYPGVASATFQGGNGPFCNGVTLYRICCDTLTAYVYGIDFVPRSDFFKTFRFSESGRLGHDDLDSMTFDDGSSVLSAETFPGRSTIGFADTISGTKVAATVGLVRVHPSVPPACVKFVPNTDMNVQAIVLRISENIDEHEFLPAFSDWAKKRLRAGNFYISDVQSYADFMNANSVEVKTDVQMRTVLGLFFLFCLFLGVSGTFWMQTSSRREEIGIMKSFGASSTCIVCTLIAEGVILAAVAVAIGCFLYLQYALKEGLYIPNNGEGDLLLGRYWFEHFSSHFAATSVVAFVIVAAVVCIGIYIPAHRISLVTPADALHDE